MKLERSSEWQSLSLNHLEGRTARFFCYTDGGANELEASGRPKMLRHPAWFDPHAEPFENERDAFAPLVWQCRFGGVEVPDDLWLHVEFGAGKPYSDNQAEHLAREAEVLHVFNEWVERFAAHVRRKGKVEPGQYRAAGYQAPSHRIADLKLKWRELRMSAGAPPPGSSPAAQQALGINRDATFSPEKSESEKLKKYRR